jgi:hypothetical protein
MSARWTVYLRETPNGWEWGRTPETIGWGWYKTKGHAVSAAKRSITPTVGKKTKPANVNLVIVKD